MSMIRVKNAIFTKADLPILKSLIVLLEMEGLPSIDLQPADLKLDPTMDPIFQAALIPYQKIALVKRYRQLAGVDLKAALDYVTQHYPNPDEGWR